MTGKTDRRAFLRQAIAAGAYAGSAALLCGATCRSEPDTLRTVVNVSPAALKRFATFVQGRVLQPSHEDYASACQLWTGGMPKHPGIVVCCANTEDVATTVKFARDQELELAVRGGGHTPNATCEGGILINLAAMHTIQVDPKARTAHIQAGTLNGAVDEACAPLGLAAVIGECPSVGVSGLTLGGGLGRLMGQHGALCDNVLRAELVTADGSIEQLSAESNDDLFWAIRGGSGNFGVATSFDFRLHPVSHALAGMLHYPISQARAVLTHFGAFMKTAPDTLDALVEIGSGILQYAPGTTEPILVINVCCSGDPASAAKTLRPLRAFGSPLRDTLTPMSYFRAQTLGDVTDLLSHIHTGHGGYRKSGFVTQLTDEVIDPIVAHCENPPSRAWSIALDHYLHGAVRRRPEDACAFNLRVPGFSFRAAAFQEGAGASEATTNWVTHLTEALQPYSGGHIYLNYLTDQGEAGVRAAFGTNFPRLAQLKKKYDPTNVFHLNPNITPAPSLQHA